MDYFKLLSKFYVSLHYKVKNESSIITLVIVPKIPWELVTAQAVLLLKAEGPIVPCMLSSYRKFLLSMRCLLTDLNAKTYLVAVIGAGPAGLYAAQFLARQGVQVVIFNRDIKPGGLAEYGIFPDKQKMRTGLMAQFHRILHMPNIRYVGNVTIGQSGDLKLDQLRQAGFQAFMVTTGAQKQKWLGLPGEDLAGVYQANDLVFHYNRLPAFAEKQPDIGHQVVMIGAGNVMLDIVNYLRLESKQRLITAYARRGPGQVKFDQQTLEPVAGCLDMEAIDHAVQSAMSLINHSPYDLEPFYELLTKARQKSTACNSKITLRMAFLKSPRRLLGDETGHVKAIVFESNQLVFQDDEFVAQATGEFETIPADTVIFSIGSQVDEGFGLPISQGNYVTNPAPRYPVDGISYEVYNPDLCAHCEDIFVSGWARSAGEGIVGLARKDAERGAKAILSYLDTLKPISDDEVDAVLMRLPALDKETVDLQDLEILEKIEQEIAAEKGLKSFKFGSKEAMLQAIKNRS